MERALKEIVYEYSIIRYVPDVERGECVNVGLMMMCKRVGWMRVEVCVDGRRIMDLWPGADVGRLECQLGAFVREDVPASGLPVEERYRWLAAVKSAIIQVSPSHPGIVSVDCDGEVIDRSCARRVLDASFERLFKRLV